MGFLHKIKASPYYERLKNSLEFSYYWKRFRNMLVGMVFVAALMILVAILDSPDDGDALAIAWCMIFGFGFLGLGLYQGYCLLEIFLHTEGYHFCQTVLERPTIEHSRFGSRVRYNVEFTDRHGKILRRDTAAMFSSDWEPTLEEYNNQTVLIGYNEETDRVVVIGRENG